MSTSFRKFLAACAHFSKQVKQGEEQRTRLVYHLGIRRQKTLPTKDTGQIERKTIVRHPNQWKEQTETAAAPPITQIRMQMRPAPAAAAVTMPTFPPSVTPRSGSGGLRPCRSTGRALRPERARSGARAALGCPAASRSTPWLCRMPTGRALQV